MIIEKSVIEWNDLKELPREDAPILILCLEGVEMVVYACKHNISIGGFYDPTMDWRGYIYNNVQAWAYYPVLGIVMYDRQCLPHICMSVAGG